MATITKAELRNAVLRKLQVLPAGVAASGEDAAEVDAIIDAVFESYNDVLPFPSDEIPLWAREPLVDMVGARCSPYFGNAPISKTEETALGDFVTARRNRMDPHQEPTEAQYY